MRKRKNTERTVLSAAPKSDYRPSSLNVSYSKFPRVTAPKSEVEDAEEMPSDDLRGHWTGRLDFILSCIGYAVGLGNIWRFPYKCYLNGGGAFMVPYLIMVCFAGLPLFFMELAFGQFASLGCITIWKISRFFKGIGVAMVIISALVCIYSNIIMGYSILYLFASFTSEVPWANCNNPWNTDKCLDVTAVNKSNGTLSLLAGKKLPSEEYWSHYVLDISKSIGETGGCQWHVCLCLLLAWIIVFLCLTKGVKSSGKVVYVTATLPYIVLTILLIRGLTLEGASDGIVFYVIPKWERLKDYKVWKDAATQVFYSLGVGFGGLLTMASYNNFKNNCYRDALIVAVVNCGTSMYAGFVIFSMLGFMAKQVGVGVDEVVADGPGLTFVAYPAGLAQMPAAPFFSVLFFTMLLTIGLDSQFAMMETVISGVADEFADVFHGNLKAKVIFTGLICLVMYLLGLPMTTKAGIYWLTLMDNYSASYSLMFVVLLEIVCIMYVYGFRRFSEDICMMIGFKPKYYWLSTWLFLTPASLFFIFIMSCVDFTGAEYGNYVFEEWAQVLGWGNVAVSALAIPVWMVIEYYRTNKCVFGRAEMRKVLIPETNWGPAHKADRTGRYALLDASKAPALLTQQSDPVITTTPSVRYNGEEAEEMEPEELQRPYSSLQ